MKLITRARESIRHDSSNRQITVRVPSRVLEILQRHALDEGCSLNVLIARILTIASEEDRDE
jgi:predicted HicB family RNase H-like nuclease